MVRVAPSHGRPAGEVEEDVGALDDGRPPILIKIGPSEPEPLTVDTSVLANPDPVLHASDPAADYEQALTTLREQKDPARAKAMFARFERLHPDSSLADNATYWRGEAHFALGEYERAIRCFERLERDHPRSSKLPYARLRWGESLLRLSRMEPGAARLRDVVERHEDSPAADEARRLLARLEAKGNI